MRFARDSAESPWERVGDPIPAALGHAGFGWGVGLHGAGAPKGLDGPTKVEGDGRSPAGVFRLGPAFGYAAKPPPGTSIKYVQVTDDWRCVDDPKSRYYNLVLSAAKLEPDWASAEHMRRADELYRWGVLVDHNAIDLASERSRAAHPGAGSCIFLHVWRGPGGNTVGCAAMDRGALEQLIAWLRPDAGPVIAMLPEAQYRALKSRWALP